MNSIIASATSDDRHMLMVYSDWRWIRHGSESTNDNLHAAESLVIYHNNVARHSWTVWS